MPHSIPSAGSGSSDIFLRPAPSLRALSAEHRALFGASGSRAAADLLAACPAHRPTPLISLPRLAEELGLGGVFLKDESTRLGLGSFKALGGAYAVARIVQRHAESLLGREVPPEGLREAAVRAVAGQMTFTCATAGNHGRSVAAGARLFGAKAVIFLPEGAHPSRAAAIEAFGARPVIVPGGYDEAVTAAAQAAIDHGWRLVSDTSTAGYVETPALVMQGYSVLMQEAAAQMASLSGAPTHLVLQAGVGGFAAVASAWFADTATGSPPICIVVEPRRAASVLAGARAGHVTQLAPGPASRMAMLDCRAASWIALDILDRRARAFVTLPERAATAAARRLRHAVGGDTRIDTSESGAAGLAGLLALISDPVARADLALDQTARVLLFNTEGGPPGRRQAP